MKKLINAISNLFAFLGKANSEDNGNPSNTRTVVFYSFIIIVPCVAFTLVYVSLGKDAALIISVLGLILGFLGTLLGIKKAQKKDEANNEINS